MDVTPINIQFSFVEKCSVSDILRMLHYDTFYVNSNTLYVQIYNTTNNILELYSFLV